MSHEKFNKTNFQELIISFHENGLILSPIWSWPIILTIHNYFAFSMKLGKRKDNSKPTMDLDWLHYAIDDCVYI